MNRKPSLSSPTAQPRRHWANIAESTFVTGMLLLYGIYRCLGRWPFRLCLYPVVFYYWSTRKLARDSSLQYLQRHRRFHGGPGGQPNWRHTVHHFRVFAEVILDKMLAFTGRYRTDRLQVSGKEPLLERIRKGQGTVLVTAHTGCIELCQTIAEQQPGVKLTILVHTRHAPRFNRLMKRLSGDTGVQLLQVTEFSMATAMMLADRVGRGELIAIAGDRIPVGGGKTCKASFLGHDAYFPVGPYLIAALLKCPMYFMGCRHQDQGYAIEFTKLADQVLLPRQERDKAFAHYARLYAAQLESLLRQSPYDWFNFFPFWDQNAPASFGPST